MNEKTFRSLQLLRTLALLTLGSLAVASGSARMLPPQESAGGGRTLVPATRLKCLTRVSPVYPQGSVDQQAASIVMRVVVTKNGTVLPQHKISGPSALEMEAANALRLWRYQPYVQPNGEINDVLSDVRVDFVPNQPGGLVTHPTH